MSSETFLSKSFLVALGIERPQLLLFSARNVLINNTAINFINEDVPKINSGEWTNQTYAYISISVIMLTLMF